MEKYFGKFLLLAVLSVLLVFGPASYAQEAGLPGEPLIVPIGKSDVLWEMEDLVPGKPGGEVSYATENFPNTFNNLIGQKKYTRDVTGMIMGAGLTAENPVNGRIVPAFAKSWSLSEDGRVYTFHLREGLKFSDGKPLTAEDVVFTYRELIFNQEVDTDKRAVLRIDGELPEVELVDKLTVKFRLPEPHGPFLRRVSTGIYPKHVLAGITGEEFNDTWGRKTAKENPEKIVGAGPFKLKSFVPGEELVLTRNPHYYKVDPEGTQLPYLDRYRVIKVKENEIEFFKFKSGESDLLRAQIKDMPFLLANAGEEGWNLIGGKGKISALLNGDFLTFNWNPKEEDLGDLFRRSEFRRAVSLAINEEKIIEKVFNGFGVRQYGPISRLSPYHNPEMEELLPKHDPETARRMLDDLGIRDENGDGIREFSSGDPASFSILVNQGNEERTEIAEIIATDFENIGLEIETESLNFNEYSSRLTNSDYQSAIASILANPREPSTLSDIFTTEGPLHLWNIGQDRNLADWEKEIDGLVSKGLKTQGFQDRRKYYDEFQRIYAEELPLIYLPGESFLYATSLKLKNCEEFNRLGTFIDFAEFIWVEK